MDSDLSRFSIPPGTPGVRARYMQGFLQEVEALPEADRRAIRNAVGDELLQRVADTQTLAWLPFEVNLTLTRVVAQQLGPRRSHVFFRSLLSAAFKSPLLRALVDSVIRLRGADPAVLVGWVAKGFTRMFRDAGTWSVTDRDAGAATLEVYGLPEAAVQDEIWMCSVSSSLDALFELSNTEGATTLRDVDCDRCRAAFRLRWA